MPWNERISQALSELLAVTVALADASVITGNENTCYAPLRLAHADAVFHALFYQINGITARRWRG